MADTIIGKSVEQEILRQRIESKSPELIAIYGRCRIGKTFLIVKGYFPDVNEMNKSAILSARNSPAV